MSERIKQLAKEAGLEFTYDPTETPMRVFVEAWGEDLEKFAVLIVEECGEVAYKAFWDNPETVRGIHIKDKILEHFGVEEE